MKPLTDQSTPDDLATLPNGVNSALLDLQNKSAPPCIVWMPLGAHVVWPLGKDGPAGPVFVSVVSAMATIADRQLQQMRRAAAAGVGKQPIVDLNHTGVFAGEPLEFTFDPRRGISLRVKWLEAADRAICSSDCSSFSPQWTRAGDDFRGITPNVGALLSSSIESAFGRRMPKILPVTKREALEMRAALFFKKVNALATVLKREGRSEFPALEAFDLVRHEWPELYAAHQIKEAIQIEQKTDFLLAHGR